jgi:hypothetical protein
VGSGGKQQKHDCEANQSKQTNPAAGDTSEHVGSMFLIQRQISKSPSALFSKRSNMKSAGTRHL